MPAVERGGRVERLELAHRGEHLLQGPLEDPAAAEREQRIAREDRLLRGQVEGDVALGMAGAAHYLNAASGPGKRIAARYRGVETGDTVSLFRWPDDGAAKFLLQGQISINMVGVVMGGENVGELPATAGELPFDLRRIRCVDGGGKAGLVVMQEYAIIVRAADERVECEMSHEGEAAFLSIRMMSNLAGVMRVHDGYR
jgi:hypothetical protein